MSLTVFKCTTYLSAILEYSYMIILFNYSCAVARSLYSQKPLFTTRTFVVLPFRAFPIQSNVFKRANVRKPQISFSTTSFSAQFVNGHTSPRHFTSLVSIDRSTVLSEEICIDFDRTVSF